AADAAAKQKALEWLSQRVPATIDETRPLGKVVEAIANDVDERGLVVIVALNEDVILPQSTVNFLLRKESLPRFIVITRQKHKQLGQLAAASDGAAVLLESTGGLLGTEEVVAALWD